MMIAMPVGARRPNRATDVRTIQSLLNNARHRVAGQELLREDGIFGPRTAAAIKRYQLQVLRLSRPDGVVDPGGPTLRMLTLTGRGDASGRHPRPRTPPRPSPRPADVHPASETGQGAPIALRSNGVDRHGISDASYIDMARRLNCEVAAIRSVVETELAVVKAFDEQGRPRILFERHKFHYHTRGRFDASDPDLSHPKWGGHGKLSAQYPKLERAMRLDRIAALKSASWGAFQILGENHVQAGHATVDSFVTAMKSGIGAQAEAFVSFVLADRRLLAALRQRNWAVFARIYNGPAYRDHDYDGRMRANYQRFANGG
ncbi:N-acetylmuramidase domain-containing protein [Sphingomonas sanguinis]|uniref:Peptidoglycan-binding protein n=1 Tax=Sphingomonas sanguinis TaxID=33051 RepID=A0A147INX2_9SPHN|nr:N-acetylmuramidase family protein [Sphingomonas sanguinis]KTT96945.1 hypothetical protein SB4_14225 [Sphingomonas sanguinis]